ncbi:MAG: A/G-specific adenine glycosylase [Steroidobacteraceae bacterium]
MSHEPDASFAGNLLVWFDAHGRKDLPWQRTPTPYRVWVSEIMLQQTQVAMVIGYFDRFMERLPDVAALAAAPLDTVLHLWSGLGYYARARNLHKAANDIMTHHGGVFPESIEAVEALPGIGRSTAAAILSLSRGKRHAILDGNVKRVLTRYAGIEGYPGIRAVETQLWKLADELTPDTRSAAYTQAIMDLGATLCARSRPLCAACPVERACVARSRGLQDRLPSPKPRKARPRKSAHVVIAVQPGGAVLLERRPSTGIWGGLWSFPQFDAATDADAWITRALEVQGSRRHQWPPHHHAFTHFDLSLFPLVLSPVAPGSQVADTERYCWYDPRTPAELGLAAPVAELIRAVASRLPSG